MKQKQRRYKLKGKKKEVDMEKKERLKERNNLLSKEKWKQIIIVVKKEAVKEKGKENHKRTKKVKNIYKKLEAKKTESPNAKQNDVWTHATLPKWRLIKEAHDIE